MRDIREVPESVDPLAISTLLELGGSPRHCWRPNELDKMLRHHLAAPLHLSLGVLSAEVAHRLRESGPGVDRMMTLGQLLEHPEPPVELLKLVKRFAKLCKSDPDNPLPSEIVMLLYYASIAAAMTRTKTQITDLPARPLRRGMKWVSTQPWISSELRTLFTSALAQLETHPRTETGPVESDAD